MLREAKRRSEIYEGQHLDKRSKPELQQALKQINEVAQLINALITKQN